jgi:hypothetical protein
MRPFLALALIACFSTAAIAAEQVKKKDLPGRLLPFSENTIAVQQICDSRVAPWYQCDAICPVGYTGNAAFSEYVYNLPGSGAEKSFKSLPIYGPGITDPNGTWYATQPAEKGPSYATDLEAARVTIYCTPNK